MGVNSMFKRLFNRNKIGTMENIHKSLEWVNLTSEDGHFTFGYYDRNPWNSDNTFHLAVKIPHQDHIPTPGETAIVGYVDINSHNFHECAETQAWCHQQGSMTQWLPKLKNTFIYNDFVKEENELKDEGNWKPICRIYEIGRGNIGQFDFPIYVLSSDGKWGLSLNFARIPRRGYTYARAPLPDNQPIPDLDADGLFLVDVETKKRKLLVTYRQLLDIHPDPQSYENAFLWLNHPSFNCDASRAMVLLRHSTGSNQKPWLTYLISMNLDGTDLQCSLPHKYWREFGISHQLWGRTPREILLDAKYKGPWKEYVVFDESIFPPERVSVSKGMGPNGHVIFSPDAKWILADTYPSVKGIQELCLVNIENQKLKRIGKFIHSFLLRGKDIRCDLHPRWSGDGSLITVDTIHLGERKILMLEFKNAKTN
jgi:hypothetical protein